MSKPKKKIAQLDPLHTKFSSNQREVHQPWHSTTTEKLESYDATSDPYCIYTKTSKFKEHMHQRMNIEGERSQSSLLSKSMSAAEITYDAGMIPMERPISVAEPENFSRHKTTISSTVSGGLTFSMDLQGEAEVEVLKAILNREGYLNRLEKAVKKIGRKFKPEIADIIDLVRAASIDVVEAIVKWREAKNDHNAAYEWNGVNYLLKMPSDLDYLSGYRAVREWLGFSTKRNPFTVPFPLEEGTSIFSETVSDPKHVDGQQVFADGFVIGNITSKKLKSKYSRVDPPGELKSPYRKDLGTSSVTSVKSVGQTSITSKGVDKEPSKTSKGNVSFKSPFAPASSAAETQSFIFNNDMTKLRQAELVILKEESTYGKYRRAPDGRIMPVMLAEAAETAFELKRDDHKQLSQKSATTEKYAPHAIPSGVGIDSPRDFPDDLPDREDDDDMSRDYSVPGRVRGKEKVGGELAPIIPQGVSTMPRHPLPSTPTSSVDYVRQRKKQTIGQRLAEITELRNKVRAERLALQQVQEAVQAASGTEDKPKTGSGVRSGKNSVSKARKAVMKAVNDSNKGSLSKEDPSTASSVQKGSAVTSDMELDSLQLDTATKDELDRLTRDLNRIGKDDDKLSQLKDIQRAEGDAKRAREIERKRRLLDKNHPKIKGAIIDDMQNVYDFYAIRIQAAVRGWIARVWMKWYRLTMIQATIVIQAYARGRLARKRVSKMKRETRAVTAIQSLFRGHLARVRRLQVEGAKDLDYAATQIQKVWRRVLGVRRSANKKILQKAAAAAYGAVDTRSLFPLDVKELARRLQLAIEEPETTTFPPDEVLQLLRITVMILEAGKEQLGLTVLNHIKVRNISFLSGDNLTWEEAMMVINRSNRFVRIVRAHAYAPCAQPPRLVRVPPDTRLLYDVLRGHNPQWNSEAFEMIGIGAKCCVQLFKWITAMMEVSLLQEQFLSFIGNTFADWLTPLVNQQKISRQHEFDLAALEKRITVLDELRGQKNVDASLHALISELILTLKADSEILKENLIKSRLQEDDISANQAGLESYSCFNMRQRVKEVEKVVSSFANEFQNKMDSAEDGDMRAAHELAELRTLLVRKRVELREITVSYQLLEAQCATNRMIRIDRSRLPAENRMQAFALGEAHALLDNVILKKQVVSNRSGKNRSTMDVTQVRNLDRLQVEEDNNRAAFDELNNRAMASLEEYHITNGRALLKKQQQVTEIPFLASEEELEEDRLEDDKEAKAERLKRRQYVPDAVLFEGKVRPRPILIAYSRDIPAFLKDKIHTDVTLAMPGLFVPVDVKENMGLDLGLLQDILDARKSIIVTVDHGLTKTTRDGFKKNFEMTIKSLVPKPVVVFVMGDDSNISAPSGEVYFGVSVNDLDAMRDKEIKFCLEHLSMTLRQLLHPSIWRMMEKLSSLVVPPPVAYITVLEALFIIQADHDRFRLPDYHVAAVSWKSTQSLLKDPETLVKRLQAVPRGQASDRLLLSLTEYIKHRTWPTSDNEQRQNDMLLNLLASFVEWWTMCEQATLDKGGLPDKSFFKNSMKFLQTVVTVTDLFDPNDVLVADKRGGWQVPVAQIVRSCLQDVRVLKAVQRINLTYDSKVPQKTDKVMYSVNVYRDGSNIYFDTYDSVSSQVYMTSIKVPAVPDLLAPNTYAVTHGLNITPPQSSDEMYKRLVKLLRFEKATKQKGGRQQLICRRDYTHLGRITKKIDGHIILLNSYEAALGEVYFDAYIPAYSCHVKLLVDDETRLKMRSNYDKGIEKSIVDSNRAVELLPFYIDRLRVTPSISLLDAKGADPIGKMAVMTKFDHQGFALRVRHKGGAGLKLCSTSIRFAGVPHIVVIRVSAPCKTMRVMAYQPQTQHSMYLSISAIQRKMLFGSDKDDACNWLQLLKKRLRLVWRGEHKLELNVTISKAVKKISGKRVIMSLLLENEMSVRVNIFDPKLCTSHSCSISKDDAIRILHYESPTSHDKESTSAVREMLGKMITSTGEVYDKSQKEDLDYSAFDVSLEIMLSDKRNSAFLLRQLESVLEKTESKSGDISYTCRVPAVLKFVADQSDIAPDELTTELRRKGRFDKMVSDGSTEGVLATRRQAVVVYMENELNALAVRKEEEAKLVAQRMQEAAEALENSLNSSSANKLIQIATTTVTTAILDDIDKLHSLYAKSLDENGLPVVIDHSKIALISSDGRSLVDVHVNQLTEEQREIVVRGDRVVFERGVKINFRDGAVMWHGHVKAKIWEGSCWGGKEGVLRRFKFIVFEPHSSAYYTAVIKNTKHMREVLGPLAQDLADRDKVIEMLIHICTQRLVLVRNDVTADGEPVDEGEPYYRLEFVRDRLYMVDKVTPVQAAGDRDGLVNRSKLIDNERMRGRKILRMARRINGILMHLQVFEIPRDLKDVGLGQRTDADEKPEVVVESGESGELIFDGTVKKVKVKLQKHEVPLLRIVGYEPKICVKTTLMVDPRATAEVAGGVYSQYLDVSQRRELARLVCEALVITYPRGKPFELAVPWSGAPSESEALNASTNVFRSTAEKIMKRPGRIFRSGVVISHLDIIVTVFVSNHAKVDASAKRRGEVAPSGPPKNQIIMNFYSMAASEAFELVLSEKEQVTRLGRAIQEFPVGAARATAVRHLCRFCRATLEPDPEDKTGKVLKVDLVPVKKEFLDDYKHVGAPEPGDDIRPVGAPVVFLPLDTKGETLYKRGMYIPVIARNGAVVDKGKEYVVSVFSKSVTEGPERGLVVQLYDRVAVHTLAIHIGPSELVRLCDQCNEHDLLHDMATARWILKEDKVDVLEADFVTVTERGVLVERARKFVDSLVDIVLRDLGIKLDALGKEFPCLRSSPHLPA